MKPFLDKDQDPKTTYEIFRFKVQEVPGQAVFVPSMSELVILDLSDGDFCVYDIFSGRQSFRLEGLGSADSLLAYKTKAFSGMSGGQIFVWDLQAHIFLGALGSHGPWYSVSALDIAESTNLLISGDIKGNIRTWNLDTGETKIIGNHPEVKEKKLFSPRVDSIAISPDGEIAASFCSLDEMVILWNCHECKPIGSFKVKVSNGGFLALDFSSDGSFLLCISDVIEKRDRQKNEIIWSFSEEGNSYTCGGFTPDGSFVLCGGLHFLSLLDSETGKKLITFEGQTGQVIGLCFSSDGQQVYSASNDGTVRIWRLPF